MIAVMEAHKRLLLLLQIILPPLLLDDDRHQDMDSQSAQDRRTVTSDGPTLGGDAYESKPPLRFSGRTNPSLGRFLCCNTLRRMFS